MRKRVVLLNGPAGVGKTTIGWRLAATARNGICVHGDELKTFAVNRDPQGSAMSYVRGAAMADAHLAGGYEMVVFEFLFACRAQVDWFHDALRADVPVHMLTLWAPLATVTEREAARPGRERLGPLVAECWHTMAARLAELGALIDATQPLKDVVRQAEHALQTDQGLLCAGHQAA